MRIFLLLSIFFSLNLYAEKLKTEVSGLSAILINADTGVVLFEKNPHLRLYPASTTKIATALYVLEKKGDCLEEICTALPDCVRYVSADIRQSSNSSHPSYRLEYGGTNIGIVPNEQLPLEALLYGLMLRSGNDAANVLAYHVSGSIPQFMEELNAYLSGFELEDTHFSNPHGLYHPEHYTTASDLAKIAQRALKNPKFREIVKTVEFVRPRTNKKEEAVMVQANRLLKKGKFYYPKAIGIKTGYIFKAGNTFVAAAEHEGRTLIAVILKAPRAENCLQDAIALFELAFSEPRMNRRLFAKGYDQFFKELKDGKTLKAFLAEDVSIEYFPSEESTFAIKLHWDEMHLPILQGQKVGQMCLIDERGKMLAVSPLYAVHGIEKTFFMQAVDIMKTPNFRAMVLLFLLGIGFIFWKIKAQKEQGNRRA